MAAGQLHDAVVSVLATELDSDEAAITARQFGPILGLPGAGAAESYGTAFRAAHAPAVGIDPTALATALTSLTATEFASVATMLAHHPVTGGAVTIEGNPSPPPTIRQTSGVTTTPPDPERLGGLAWLERTSGALTRGERRSLLGAIARTQGRNIGGRLRLATGRVPDAVAGIDDTLLDPPDSVLARAAEEACREQPTDLAGHGHRTWAYGRALATIDRIPVDDELFYVAGLLHDAGLIETVTGEDFTLRSGHRAARCMEAAGQSDDAIGLVRDAISAHVTPGASLEQDGPLAYFIQAGALLDLAGFRLWDLPPAYVQHVVASHERASVTDTIVDLIRSEARAVPDGRFALLARCGFSLAVRVAPRPG